MSYNKCFDYYKKLYRSGRRILIAKHKGFYWITDGYVAHKVPENEMELNPQIFTPFDGDIPGMAKKAEGGLFLAETGLLKHTGSKSIVPFTTAAENNFTIWFDKSLLSTFPNGISLYGTAPIEAAAVKGVTGTIGIILPCRNLKDDITPFI